MTDETVKLLSDESGVTFQGHKMEAMVYAEDVILYSNTHFRTKTLLDTANVFMCVSLCKCVCLYGEHRQEIDFLDMVTL